MKPEPVLKLLCERKQHDMLREVWRRYTFTGSNRNLYTGYYEGVTLVGRETPMWGGLSLD